MENNKKPDQITYYEHEAEIARQEMHVQRIEDHAKKIDQHFHLACLACLIVFVALVASNVWWVWRSMTRPTLSNTQNATSEGGNAIIYGDRSGAIFYSDSEAADYGEETGTGK